MIHVLLLLIQLVAASEVNIGILSKLIVKGILCELEYRVKIYLSQDRNRGDSRVHQCSIESYQWQVP